MIDGVRCDSAEHSSDLEQRAGRCLAGQYTAWWVLCKDLYRQGEIRVLGLQSCSIALVGGVRHPQICASVVIFFPLQFRPLEFGCHDWLQGSYAKALEAASNRRQMEALTFKWGKQARALGCLSTIC